MEGSDFVHCSVVTADQLLSPLLELMELPGVYLAARVVTSNEVAYVVYFNTAQQLADVRDQSLPGIPFGNFSILMDCAGKRCV